MHKAKVGKSQLNYQEHDRGSWVNIKLVKEDGRVSGDPSSGGEDGARGALKPEGKKIITSSLDRVNVLSTYSACKN